MVSPILTSVAAVAAAVAAIVSTAAIERFGGSLGGILASMPTTILPYSIGLSFTSTSDAIIDAFYSVPVGISANIFFLLVWRELPTMPRFRALSPALQLAALITASLGIWLVLALIIVVSMQSLKNVGVPVRAMGLTFFVSNYVMAVVILFRRHVPSPAGKRKISLPVYLSRGVLAALSIAASILIASTNSLAAGVASVFPAITLTAMVSLWVSQGGASVPSGATAPIMLGNASVSCYAMVFAELFNALRDRVELGGAIAASMLVAEAIAVPCFSYTGFRLLSWRRAQQQQQQQQQLMAESGGGGEVSDAKEGLVAVARSDDDDVESSSASYVQMMELGSAASVGATSSVSVNATNGDERRGA